MQNHLILQVFRQPDALSALTLADWDVLLRQARHANLLARLHALTDEYTLLEKIPAQARRHLEWTQVVAARHSHAVHWEVEQIRKALSATGVPIILLKGAAYAIAKLPPARGRLFSDIDILVPKNSLDAVEAALMMHGWISAHHDAYDQRYYRTWMHELPPMQHIKRMTVIDVHHAIVPETAPIHPDPEKLRATSRLIAGYDDVMVLNPTDLVLHSAVHLFHDGELDNGLRDLVDIHGLLNEFGTLPSFWSDLVERAQELQLTRPLFYALRYAVQLLHANIPAKTIDAANVGRPNTLLLALMDQLFTRALLPQHASCSDSITPIARHMLYIRANWLRMPPWLLVRHLFHKAFLSSKTE